MRPIIEMISIEILGNRMYDMKLLIGALLASVAFIWGLPLLTISDNSASLPWMIRQQALLLSGLLSFAMLSLVMFLATRPVWLETPLGGMDRIYRSHKWAGILGVSFAVVHWLVEEVVGDILKVTIGRAGRVPKEQFTGVFEVLRDLAKDMGEWAFYLVLLMLVITLWQRFPYRPWRMLHRIMPVLYLMLLLHAVMLAPSVYWQQPVGLWLVLLGCIGAYGAGVALLGRIGRTRQISGQVTAIEQSAADILAVCCQLDSRWPGHRPGQFAFVTFDDREGAHPYTIASADRGDGCVEFQIKALGDDTRNLGQRLAVGQRVRVEGPYGRFELGRQNAQARQVWIAGGIGLTPFLAWLDALELGAAPLTADLHYCTRDRENDPWVERLKARCVALPGIRLHIYGDRQGEVLSAAACVATPVDAAQAAGGHRTEIWFCGPQGLAAKLKQGFREIGAGPYQFHQEAFVMR